MPRYFGSKITAKLIELLENMRALITYSIEAKIKDYTLNNRRVVSEVIKRIKKTGFLPITGQQTSVIAAVRESLLGDISNDYSEWGRRHIAAIIFHEPSKSWGGVFICTNRSITIAFKNNIDKKLKQACECFIQNINDARNDSAINLIPGPVIEVIKPKSFYPDYTGRIINRKKAPLALSERHQELYIATISIVAMLTILYITSPFFSSFYSSINSNSMTYWIYMNLEKMNSALFISFTVSSAKIFTHWRHLKAINVRW